MFRPSASFVDGQGPLEEGLGGGVVPLRLQQQRQVVQAVGGVGVAHAQRRLADGQGLLVEGPGGGVVPLRLQQHRQVVQAGGGVGVVLRPAPACGWPGPARRGAWRRRSPPGPASSAARLFRLVAVSGWCGAQHRLADGQGLLEEGLGGGIVPLRLQQHRQVVQAGGGVGVVLAQHLLVDGQGLAGLRRRLAIAPLPIELLHLVYSTAGPRPAGRRRPTGAAGPQAVGRRPAPAPRRAPAGRWRHQAPVRPRPCFPRSAPRLAPSGSWIPRRAPPPAAGPPWNVASSSELPAAWVKTAASTNQYAADKSMVQRCSYNGRKGGQNRPSFFRILLPSYQKDAKPKSNDREGDIMPHRWPEETDFGGTSRSVPHGVRFLTTRTNSAVLQSVTSAVTTSTERLRSHSGG